MRRRWLTVVAVIALAAGFASEGATSPAADSTVAAGEPMPPPGGSLPDTGSTVPVTSPGSGVNALTPGSGEPIVVGGGLLPRAVVDAVVRRGGELVDSSVWDARFETLAGVLTGGGVHDEVDGVVGVS